MREYYARAYADRDGVELTLGVEIKPGDDIGELTYWAKSVCEYALGCEGGNHAALISTVELQLLQWRPGRAYFIETEEDGKGVQVYDPRDFVKERCECADRVTVLECRMDAAEETAMEV